MAPGFYIDVTPINDIQWIDPSASSTTAAQRLYSPTTTSSYSFRSDDTSCHYNSSCYSPSKKEETRKERLVRWSEAFKIFYPKLEFILIKTQNDDMARYRETYLRRYKFKGQNRNLML